MSGGIIPQFPHTYRHREDLQALETVVNNCKEVNPTLRITLEQAATVFKEVYMSIEYSSIEAEAERRAKDDENVRQDINELTEQKKQKEEMINGGR